MPGAEGFAAGDRGLLDFLKRENKKKEGKRKKEVSALAYLLDIRSL